jgi:hypothetical protein
MIQYVKVAFFANYGLIPRLQCVWKPPLIHDKQKRRPTLIGIVRIVNLKLHNSEIELEILQKCKNKI